MQQRAWSEGLGLSRYKGAQFLHRDSNRKIKKLLNGDASSYLTMTSQNRLTTVTTFSHNFVNIQLQRKPQEVNRASFITAIDCKRHFDHRQHFYKGPVHLNPNVLYLLGLGPIKRLSPKENFLAKRLSTSQMLGFL